MHKVHRQSVGRRANVHPVVHRKRVRLGKLSRHLHTCQHLQLARDRRVRPLVREPFDEHLLLLLGCRPLQACDRLRRPGACSSRPALLGHSLLLQRRLRLHRWRLRCPLDAERLVNRLHRQLPVLLASRRIRLPHALVAHIGDGPPTGANAASVHPHAAHVARAADEPVRFQLAAALKDAKGRYSRARKDLQVGRDNRRLKRRQLHANLDANV
mmetsp:Transcript_10317/g.32631  ORF Transcript_10317/g.32631 Transcript_10317/m.32631 type:complete len:213 (-) Transcript_10317:932-1570(-)